MARRSWSGPAEDPSLLAPFLERQRLVDKPLYDELEKRYTDR